MFFAVILLPIICRGQFEGFRNYNVKDGLPSSDIYGVMQDSKGYIWTIGDMGVSSFDGYEFKNYDTDNGMPDNVVFNMFEDNHQQIWFLTFSGKLCYIKNDSIYQLPCNVKLAQSFTKGITGTSLFIDSNDTIWIGTNAEFYIKINPNRQSKDINVIKKPQESYILIKEHKHTIFGGYNFSDNSIKVYDQKTNPVLTLKVFSNNDRRINVRFNAIKLNDGTFLASYGNKIVWFNYSHIIKQFNIDATVIKIKQDLNGTIFLCTYKGAYIIDSISNGKLRSINQFKGKVITDVFIDKEKGQWFSTEGHGIFYMPYSNIKYYTFENGLSQSKVSVITPFNNYVLTGHLDEHLNFLYPDTVIKIRMQSKSSNNQGSFRIYSIANINEQPLISTSWESFYLKENNKSVILDTVLMAVKKIIFSPDHVIVLSQNKLYKLRSLSDLKQLEVMHYKQRLDYMYEDCEKKLWFCGYDGLYILKHNHLEKIESENKMYSARLIAIDETKNKKKWIITRGAGVIIRDGSISEKLTEANGLASNSCKSILADSNCVWIGTNKGLSKITENNSKYIIQNYYTENGLLTNEINHIIKYKNRIWLTHSNGITIFDPQDIKTNNVGPLVYILKTTVNDKEQTIHHSELKYNENNISINFIGLCYKDADHPEYKYKLEGIDQNWITSKFTTVRYGTIPAGTYTFNVYAKNNDGIWSNKSATIMFKILPAWYNTWWFITICIVVGISLIGLLFKYRMDSIRKTEFEKEMLRHRISAIELQALRSQMNPHFVFNAINSVQYFITDNDPESSQLYLEKFASLIRYVLDNSKLTPIPLKAEIEALKIYMEIESLRFMFNYKIIIAEDKAIDHIYIPSMLIQPYVENAIWHGLMHKKDIGEIIITFVVNEYNLKCIIEDNGIGRKRSEELKVISGKIKTHKSIGMSITKERLDIINTLNQSNLKVTIVDLINNVNESIGTRVEIDIPF